MNKSFACIAAAFALIGCTKSPGHVGLAIVPYGTVTDKIDLDVRVGIVNDASSEMEYDIRVTFEQNDTTVEVSTETISVGKGQSYLSITTVPMAGMCGAYNVKMEVLRSDGRKYADEQHITVVPSDIRSDRSIDGAWCGIYHWSEIEGKMWNKDIKELSDEQWKELVRSMHSVGMDMIVVQEVFRNEYYVGRHNLTVENYEGRAFYPSKIYPGRMPIAAEDPLEAIFSEADLHDMNVMIGVGMFAWFDFTPESLEWHKLIARELWEMYGHHKSFYGFYISEECDGSLTTYDANSYETTIRRKQEIVEFFKRMQLFCAGLAPEKPIMLATNSMNTTQSIDTYKELLRYLDILCPFGFARMPSWDITGKEAADNLQALCDEAGAHLWFDLEAFLFNEDTSLYPKPIELIVDELTMFDNFEKVLCYQFPGVFCGPQMSKQVGEDRTIQLYKDYSEYFSSLNNCR